MAAGQRTDDQSRHNFVAHAQKHGAVEHLVRQADGGAHGNHITREQRKFHTFVTLCNAVAHGGCAACHLRCGIVFCHFVFNPVGKIFKWLMRRHHVVIGSNDADIGDIMLLHGNFDGFGHGGIAVR